MYLENGPQKGEAGLKYQGEDWGLDLANGGHDIGVGRLYFGTMAWTVMKDRPHGCKTQTG